MKKIVLLVIIGTLLGILVADRADGRGFGGGFRGGSFGGGGFGGGSIGGFRSDSFGGFSSSGFRDTNTFSGLGGGFGATSSYDRTFSGDRGGSINVDGTRGAVSGPLGGFAAGGTRDVTATGPQGRTYSGDRDAGVAVGPYGRVVGGGSKTGVASGPGRTIAGTRDTAFAGSRMSTDLGLAHYSSFNTAAVGHSTVFWSHSAVTTRAGYVRTGFGFYNHFSPLWYSTHPGAWVAAGWAAGAAWEVATWPAISTWCAIPAPPVYYDYGSTIVYQDNQVFVTGQPSGIPAAQYAQQATTIADQGQKAKDTPQQEWKSLGVFALVQGDEKTSNNLFQIAVSKEGVLRGNYYDGLMDTTTPIYGSVDLKTQRAAWTIGKKNDRVFETGIDNLTKGETPILVHFGTDRTQQWLLVRVEKPKSAGS